ncbi:MAG: hypothetical protein HY084_08640 [Gemmatimonadetes bacterium]|nr:hypothetical protein [Gemmatimonadota bacterium]
MTERATPARERVEAWAAVALFAAFRLPWLVRLPPWTDEIFTLGVVAQPFRDMVVSQADDQTNPPLFYLALWAWRAAGPHSLWWSRLLPCLFGILLALPVLSICRRARLGAAATALALSLVAASQALIFHSNELRNYSLYALLAAWSLALWLRVRERATRRDLLLLTAVNVALVNTHYVGCVVVAVEWIDAAGWARARLRAITLSAAVTACSLLPWLWLVARRARRSGDVLGNAGWIPRPSVGDLFDPYRWILGRSPWIAVDLALLVALGGLLALHVTRSRRSNPATTPLALLAFAPSLIVLAVSMLTPMSIWVARYVLACAVPFLVLTAAALTETPPAPLRRFAILFALWPAALSVTAIVDGTEKVRYDRLAAQMVAASSPRRADVFTSNWVEGGPLAFQARRLGGVMNVAYTPSPSALTATEGWFVWSEHHPPPGPPPTVLLHRHGYRTGDALSAAGMWDDMQGRTDSVVAVPFHRDPR